MLKRNQLKKLLASLFALAISISPSLTFAFECEYVQDSKRLVKCQEETMYLFPEEKGHKLLTDVKLVPKLKKENNILKRKNKIKERKIKMKNDYISFLESEVKNEREISKKLIGSGFPKKKKFWETDWFKVVTTVVVTSGIYAGWQYTFGKAN